MLNIVVKFVSGLAIRIKLSAPYSDMYSRPPLDITKGERKNCTSKPLMAEDVFLAFLALFSFDAFRYTLDITLNFMLRGYRQRETTSTMTKFC